VSELTTKRARCLVASLFGVTLPSDEVRIKDITPFGLSLGSESTALVTALVRVDFRLARDPKGWHVAEFKSGGRDWVSVAALPAAIDDFKRSAATDELSIVAKALADFRRERGYFVVSDKESVLIDHLSPRYLVRVIRVDPWQRPYQYEGQQDHYSLRSLGPDGKPNTADDIVVSAPIKHTLDCRFLRVLGFLSGPLSEARFVTTCPRHSCIRTRPRRWCNSAKGIGFASWTQTPTCRRFGHHSESYRPYVR
jgi:hypothetical protein